MKTSAISDSLSLKALRRKKESLARVETLPYNETLRSVMDTSIYTCPPEQRVKDVVREISRRGVSSVVVVDPNNRPVGILTEKDILQRIVAADGVDIETTAVAEVMTQNPFSLKPDDTIYQALSLLSTKGVKHLPLVEHGRMIGIVTLRQLLKLKYPEPMVLIEGIQTATDIAQLKAIKHKLTEIAALKFRMGIRASDIVTMLSLINQDIHRKTFDLALDAGGAPPSPVCLYVTGSHGRLENLLVPDQDHGLIIADTEAGDTQYDPYYAELTEKFAAWLDEIGFDTCPGYIMASNPLWRKSLAEWKLQLQYWFDTQVRELGRYVTVLFDAAPIYGEEGLFREVSDFAFALLSKHHEVLRILHEEEGRHKAPTGILGRFVTERSGEHRGELDVKRSGLLFIVEGVRVLALFHGIRETSTLKRLEKLVEGGFLHHDDGEYFESAYQVLLHFALSTQLDKALLGDKIVSFLDPHRLSQHDKETLRHAFKAIQSLQDLVAAEFGELIL